MIYLYGVLDPAAQPDPAALDGLAGVTGPAGIATLPVGHLIHGPHDGGEILAKRRNLLAHTRVLEALLPQGTLLPMRFGMVAADLVAVAEMLEARRARLAEEFARLGGQVEVGLRLSFDRTAALACLLDAAPDLRAERDRLLGRARGAHFEQAELGRRLAERLERRRTEAQSTLARRLAPYLTDSVLRAPEEDVQVLALDALLPATEERRFAETVAQAAAECGFAPGAEPRIRLIGPVPPFSFVRLSLDAPHRDAA